MLDFLVIRCHEWLLSETFITPILLSIYIVFSLIAGDTRLDNCALWAHFNKFIACHELLPLQEIDALKMEIRRCLEVGVLEALGEIPLRFTFEKMMRKRNEQLYIPKIECIL